MKCMTKAIFLALALLSAGAQAAVCTTNAGTSGWGTASTWSCGHVPLATDTVEITRNISLGANRTVAGVTVSAGATLSGGNRNLTVSGPVVVDGTYSTGGGDLTTTGGGALTINAGGTFNFNGGNAAINGNVAIDGTLTSGGDNLQMTGTGTTLSGTGNIVGSTIEIDATGVSVPVGANLVFDANSEVDVGANNAGSLTINGTIDGTAQGVGDRIVRVSDGGTLTVGSTGFINAPNSELNVRDGGTATNNGTITIRDLIGRNRTPRPVYAQGANSTLNVSGTICAATSPCTFNASAAGNVVNYTGAAQTVYSPVGSTYANLTLSGSGVKTVPTGLTVAENFTMSGTATVLAPLALAVGGDFTIGAGNTFTPGLGTVTLNGAAAQTISGNSPLSFNNLTVSNAANPNITLATDVVVNGTLSGTVNLTNTCPVNHTLTSNGGATVAHSCPTTVVSINRLDADPTSAATVRWTVTFSRNVTGVDASPFALAPTGVSGAYITSVTGSGTTWIVTANTGIGSGTLGLDQTGPGSVVPALAGTFTGEVYTITATPALAEYRMDEAGWNGTGNEVVDSSGSGNHGQAFNNANTDGTTPAIASDPGTCRYGVFDNGTITQGYVQTPLPNLTTDFTVTAWIRTTDNTVGAQRILVDDQNNTGGYGLSLGEGGTGVLRFYSRGSSVIILDTGNVINNNTWYFVAGVADITNGNRKIYVFDATGSLLPGLPVSVASTGWGTDAGPVSIGAEVNGPPQTELPATHHFKGSLDEVRVYQKVLSQSALAAIATQTHTCPIVIPNHIRIEHDGNAISCSAEAVVVRACANADCSSLFTNGVSGNLTAGGNSVPFSIAAGSGQTTVNIHLPSDSAAADPQTVRLGANSVLPAVADAGSPYCSNSGGPLNNTTSCDVSVYKAGFLFDVPHLASGAASGAVNVSAVRSSDSTTCVPLFQSVTRTVALWGDYQNPVSGTLPLQVNGGNIETTAAPAYTSTYSLVFDNTGVATLASVQYDDVGLMQLNARYVGSTSNTPPDGGMIVLGSDTFVVKPDHFDLSAIRRTSDDFANPAAADAAGNKFVKAGEQFSVTVTAKNALGNTTPNYGQESTPESVKLTSALAGGLGLTNNPAVSGVFGAFSNGVATADGVSLLSDGVTPSTPFTWNEVGIITLTPSVGDGDYLGALDVSGTESGNVGRFYPDHFVLSAGVVANRSDLSCAPASTFTYMGEPMSLTLTIAAQNAANGATQNYAGSFAKLDGATAGKWTTLGGNDSIGLGAVEGATNALTARLAIDGAPSGSWAAGTGTLTAGVVLNRAAAPDGVFDNLKLGAAPQDADGVTLLPGALDLDADLDTTPERRQAATTKVRYGRVRLDNAHGSELLALPVPLKVEYYASSGFVTNGDDSCTGFLLTPVVDSSPASYQYGDLLLDNALVNMTVAASTPTFAGNPVNAGQTTIKLSKPGSGKNGSVDLTLTVPAWLQYAWGGGSDPKARATFGVYKGNNEFIYLREAY